MPPWLKQLTTFLFGPPLHEFWILMTTLIVGCYALAFLFFHALPSEATVIHRARSAWGLAFLLHAVAALAVFVHWYFGHRMLATFGSYVWFYALVIVVDLIAGIGLMTSARRFRRYR